MRNRYVEPTPRYAAFLAYRKAQRILRRAESAMERAKERLRAAQTKEREACRVYYAYVDAHCGTAGRASTPHTASCTCAVCEPTGADR